ncbi:MAG: hypothetical protein KAT00_00150 [Planctomycetes bacterium]|nr:hypothetical protein [Planctomycetota bacterium]
MKARELTIEPCDVRTVRAFIETNHYSKSINGVKISQCFAVTFEGVLVGAVLFGGLSTTAWKRFATSEREVLELRRLVLIDECPKNSESRTIAACLKWLSKNMPEVTTVVSYADPMFGHSGVVYRASNFRDDGTTPDDWGFLDPETGKTYHSRALRTKYKGEFKPFVRRLRAKLDAGLLVKTRLLGKHRYVYDLRRK